MGSRNAEVGIKREVGIEKKWEVGKLKLRAEGIGRGVSGIGNVSNADFRFRIADLLKGNNLILN